MGRLDDRSFRAQAFRVHLDAVEASVEGALVWAEENLLIAKDVGDYETEIRYVSPEGSRLRMVARPGEIENTKADLARAGATDIQEWRCRRVT